MNCLAKIIRSIDSHPQQELACTTMINTSRFHTLFGKFPIQARLDHLSETNSRTKLKWEFQPWVQRTSIQLLSNASVIDLVDSNNRFSQYKPPVGVPYRHNTNFAIFPLKVSKNKIQRDEIDSIKTEFENHIISYEDKANITIYTDASVDPINNKATYACAVYIQNEFNDALSIQKRISDQSGSMTTELHAIKEAVKIVCINANNLQIKRFLIVTDSMSGVQALANTNNPDNRACVFEIHRRLELLKLKSQIEGTILWCPSHIGIPGNEMADQLAGKAMHLDLPIIDTPASISSIKSKIKSATKCKWLKDCTVSDYFKTINPELKPFKVPTTSRNIQVRLMKLRHNAYKYCPYRCHKLCSYCESPFSTGHYLISCPATRSLTSGIKCLLTQDQHADPEDIQAAFIFQKLKNSTYEQFLEIIKTKPPDSFCPTHPYTPKFRLPLP